MPVTVKCRGCKWVHGRWWWRWWWRWWSCCMLEREGGREAQLHGRRFWQCDVEFKLDQSDEIPWRLHLQGQGTSWFSVKAPPIGGAVGESAINAIAVIASPYTAVVPPGSISPAFSGLTILVPQGRSHSLHFVSITELSGPHKEAHSQLLCGADWSLPGLVSCIYSIYTDRDHASNYLAFFCSDLYHRSRPPASVITRS